MATTSTSQQATGSSRLARSKVFAKRVLYKGGDAEKARANIDLIKVVSAKKASLLAPAVTPRPKAVRKSQNTPSLRKSITPGTVLILLAGRFRGKRVVFLKQLKSGLLLVTGPFKINGVPLRRVNQAYVIATSTKVDLSGVEVDAKFDDAYFKREVQPKMKGTEEEFFGENAQKKEHPAHKIADQKVVDKSIAAAVAKTPYLASYLASNFSLSNGQAPHTLKF
ncbi:60S ribosomal protein L6 [Coemansia interrupta]|uniref:60S ribosomal protein L6 n=1 Tax=Coemansia interrupta TaxID=1126814 RepID=A0A9W8HT71_9FUNG|nr:60S ribosomal protein L6 [Coemansia interrupta]